MAKKPNTVVYRFNNNDGKAIAIGIGSPSRYNTLEKVRLTGKISSGVHNKITFVLLLREQMTKPGILLFKGLTNDAAKAEERKLHAQYGGNIGNCVDLMVRRLDDRNISNPEDRWMFLNWAKHGDQLSTGRLDGCGKDDPNRMPPRIRNLIIEVLGDIF